jgi:phenylacetate-coenzyme A ligase PaaK-like adenylate-forming protein
MAAELAEEQASHRLEITPEAIFTSSEVLSDGMREKIESVWGNIIFNQYASTETGGIAAECSLHNGMHVFEDHVIIEVVDKDNKPVNYGEFGDKLLVTTLFSRTQPLIRYTLSDSLRLSRRVCNDGKPFKLIDAVQGRAEDTLYIKVQSGQTVALHPNVFHAVMDSVQVGEWQIVQKSDGIHVLVTAEKSDLEQRMREALAALGVYNQEIVIEQVQEIPRSSIGKRVLIKSENTSH